MGLTVYAEGMGFFHKGSGGKGVAPIDICLTPPPPPTGPIPVPYVNMLQSSNLAKGSKSVKIDGEPTALENASHVSTSTGNEAATQGGGVVTHKTKGKGSFKLWSFTVKVENKGVARHGDLMEQNTASPLPNCVCPLAINKMAPPLGDDWGKTCDDDWDKKEHYSNPTDTQATAVLGGPCWECKETGVDPGVWDTSFLKDAAGQRILVGGRATMGVNPKKRHLASTTATQEGFTPDHQPPQSLAWKMGGCHMKKSPDAFISFMKDDSNVKPHCKKHSSQQGGVMSHWKKA
jgi:uncharacterized Zn-binding protein involved in type VI secretion